MKLMCHELICLKVCIKFYLKKMRRVSTTDTVIDDTAMSLLNTVESNEYNRMELSRFGEPERGSKIKIFSPLL
jgi:hypothetical protein